MCRVLFPDVVLGAGYVPEELGAEVTPDGELVEAEVVDDDLMPMAEGKHAVLDAMGGNVDQAKHFWVNTFGTTAPTRSAITEALEGLTSSSPAVDDET